MKHKCAVRDCHKEGCLVWDKGLAYFCVEHFQEMLKKEKKECGLK